VDRLPGGIRYEGTVRGFRNFALPALRKAAMKGVNLIEGTTEIQRELRNAEMLDLRDQILASNRT